MQIRIRHSVGQAPLPDRDAAANGSDFASRRAGSGMADCRGLDAVGPAGSGRSFGGRAGDSEPGYFWRRPSLPRSWTFSTRHPGSSGDTVATSSWSRQSPPAIRRSFFEPTPERRVPGRFVADALVFPVVPGGADEKFLGHTEATDSTLGDGRLSKRDHQTRQCRMSGAND